MPQGSSWLARSGKRSWEGGEVSSPRSEKLRKIRRVNHSPTDRPSRRAAARAASRASGGIPATFQGSSARIESTTPHPQRKVSAPRYSVKDRRDYEVRHVGQSAKSCTEFWRLIVNGKLVQGRFDRISVGSALGTTQAQGIGQSSCRIGSRICCRPRRFGT